MYHNNFFTEEQWECIRVCVANAPIPYDITKKKIPAEILDKIGQPKREKHEGEILVNTKMDSPVKVEDNFLTERQFKELQEWCK